VERVADRTAGGESIVNVPDTEAHVVEHRLVHPQQWPYGQATGALRIQGAEATD
jgi:hypothetical protein